MGNSCSGLEKNGRPSSERVSSEGGSVPSEEVKKIEVIRNETLGVSSGQPKRLGSSEGSKKKPVFHSVVSNSSLESLKESDLFGVGQSQGSPKNQHRSAFNSHVSSRTLSSSFRGENPPNHRSLENKDLEQSGSIVLHKGSEGEAPSIHVSWGDFGEADLSKSTDMGGVPSSVAKLPKASVPIGSA